MSAKSFSDASTCKNKYSTQFSTIESFSRCCYYLCDFVLGQRPVFLRDSRFLYQTQIFT